MYDKLSGMAARLQIPNPRDSLPRLKPGTRFLETLFVKRQVAILQVIEALQALAAPRHVAQRVRIEPGGDDLLAAPWG